jgi:phosphatidylinositol 3-kinase
MPLYDIILINSSFGIIEYVENSTTLREISDKNYSIQNYILDNKINANISIFEIKDRFMKSLSISSCVCYIIGLADRHLDNIMITDNGLLFHIDFGYIHENPKTNILGSPIIKMTEDMIDFLGGNQGILYNKFKKYTVSFFEILRHYNNIIYSFYNILGFENIISWTDFSSKINNRFLYGMDSKDIEISLINEIEKSSSHYTHKIYDYIHKIRN